MSVEFAATILKPNVLTKNASVALTFMFVRVRRNPIEIPCLHIQSMAKIKNIDEFKLIRDGDFGFIVIFDGASNTLHQSNCSGLTDDTFANSDGSAFHWFATLAVAEKSFNITPCGTCKPE